MKIKQPAKNTSTHMKGSL